MLGVGVLACLGPAQAMTMPALTSPAGAVPAATAPVGGRAVVQLRDPRIVESSGLVDLGSRLVTVNDSGNAPVLFVVSATSGRTVGVTRFSRRASDVEALAPAGPRSVWVGDIGDNRGRRSTVTIYRVPVAPGNRTVRPAAYRFAYPRGGHDAESLFVDGDGRLHLVTKSFEGGTVYQAPLRPSRTRLNPLVPEGRVLEYATDAAMYPDGRHVLVRGLGLIGIYQFPALRRIGSFALPRQRQGEGLSISDTGRILLSSEGRRSSVLQVAVPRILLARMRPEGGASAPLVTSAPSPSASASPGPSASASPSVSASGTPSASASPTSSAGSSPGSRPDPSNASSPTKSVGSNDPDGSRQPWLLWSIPLVIAVGAAGIGLGLRRRAD